MELSINETATKHDLIVHEVLNIPTIIILPKIGNQSTESYTVLALMQQDTVVTRLSKNIIIHDFSDLHISQGKSGNRYLFQTVLKD